MIRVTMIIILLVTPALAEDSPKSVAGTAFMEMCLTDVSAHRIATFKRQAPDFAATLGEEELRAGGIAKAQKACPCFLHIVAIDPAVPGDNAEAKVEYVVNYLKGQKDSSSQPMPPTISRLTRLCGERSSILPPGWINR